MAEEERYPVLTIVPSTTYPGAFEVTLPCIVGYTGTLVGKTVELAMDAAADFVANYKELQSNDRRIAEIDAQIEKLQAERQALGVSLTEQLPIYSLLVPHELELYKKNLASVDPEYLNWFEAKYNRTVTKIDLVEAEGGNIYGSPLIWRWYTVANPKVDKLFS